MATIDKTELNIPEISAKYEGKVRDVYTFPNQKLALIATDRISAFDTILPKGIPYKGQVLTGIAEYFLKATADIVPNWLEDVPHPNVMVGKQADPIRIEMVIRGYLAGHAWRTYAAGKRTLCGVDLPEGMVCNQRLPSPIITPATKAETGHDEDVSKEEILAKGLVTDAEWALLEEYTRALFLRGSEMAAERGLILVDTKYEFGRVDGQIILIDEVHTPDSSRYYVKDSYEACMAKGEQPEHLSKEFVREWLMANNFQGKEGQQVPEMSTEWVNTISERYIELYQKITGKPFTKHEVSEGQIEKAISSWLAAEQ